MTPGDPRSRLIALALLLAAVAAAWLLVIEPVTAAFAAQDEDVARSHQLLAAYERRIALRPAIEARLADLRRQPNTGVIEGASAELAAANIQNVVKALIESEAGQVRSAQNLPPVTADGFQRIEIQYDASIPMAHLKDTVYRIESAMPYLFLDGVDLRAPESWQIGPYQQDAPNLEVRWIVHGYRWAGAR